MCRSIQVLVLLFGFLYISPIKFGSSNAGCTERERHALLQFKKGLNDPRNRLSSWAGEECCRWKGVGCDNETGHVIKLDLRNQYQFDSNSNNNDNLPYNRWALGGEVNPSLLDLKHLNYLDLSMNNFGGISIPKFMGSFKKLRYLNFSRAGFCGTIPPQLGNLSSLHYLDLYNDLDPNFVPPVLEFNANNLQWLSRLASLQYLNMNNVNLEKANDWVQVINMLPSLSELHLSSCNLDSLSISPSLPSLNFTSLATLELSYNFISSTIPYWLLNIRSLEYLDLAYNFFHGPNHFGNMTSLVFLDLGFNNLEGKLPRTMGSLCELRMLSLAGNMIRGETIEFVESLFGCVKDNLETLNLGVNELDGYLPDGLGMLKNLKNLYLDSNSFHGLIPTSIGRLTSLETLDLGNNQLNGTIPGSLGQLSKLVHLDLSLNSLEGVISEGHFANLSSLEYISMYSNSLVLNVSSKWIPPFQLGSIEMGSCTLGPRFPSWLRTQKGIFWLDLSNTQIIDIMPDWFWNLISHIEILDISHNQISGKVPHPLQFGGSNIDLSSNHFDGMLPCLSSNVELLDLSNNSFSGSIPSCIGEMLPRLQYLSLSRNLINGSIPSSVCKAKSLVALDLKENNLLGELPQCWRDFSKLTVIDLTNNHIVGEIPSSMGNLYSLESLHLRNNGLSGKLPSALKNCTRLATLDLGDNKFSGNIPTWIGESLTSLKILYLRSNMFHGNIPSQLSYLTDLQILDLASNNLSGSIPRSFYNLSAMVMAQKNVTNFLTGFWSAYEESVLLDIKGRESEYSHTLSLVTIIDISGNSLSGEIPGELASLFGLQSLNLSKNHLTGKIPEAIGRLRWLESLDLSSNLLSGAIPLGMSTLTFLNHLNLSYNNFSGKIPSGNQLQTLDDPSIYIGNPKLCGPPLKGRCPGEETSQDLIPDGSDEEDGEGFETLWFFLSMVLGFVVGFWAFWGILLLKKSWRYAYFRFFDYWMDSFFECVAPKLAKLNNKKFQRNQGRG